MAKSVPFDNESCLAALRSGDDRLLGTLIDTMQPEIVAFLKRRKASTAEAEDIFFISIQTLYEAAQIPGFILTNYRGYLYSVAWKQWLKECRRKKKTVGLVTPEEPEVYYPEPDAPVDQLLEQVEQQNLVLEYIDKITDPCRRLLLLYIREQYSYEEIALEMGYSNAESARQQKFKCQKKLKILIKKDPRYRELLLNEPVKQ